jgi:hypothetical protein
MGSISGEDLGIDISQMSEESRMRLRKSYAKLVRSEVAKVRIMNDPDVLKSLVRDPQINASMREQLKSDGWPVQEKPAEIVETEVVKKFGK